MVRAMLNPRVVGILGVCYMQVCAVADATDGEILATCNRQNPAGTQAGWRRVVRDYHGRAQGPVVCAQNPGRVHFLVEC